MTNREAHMDIIKKELENLEVLEEHIQEILEKISGFSPKVMYLKCQLRDDARYYSVKSESFWQAMVKVEEHCKEINRTLLGGVEILNKPASFRRL